VCIDSPGHLQNPLTSVCQSTCPTILSATCLGSIIPPLDAADETAYPFHMADDAPACPASKRHAGSLLFWLIALLVLVYALSPGPVLKALGGKPSRAFHVIYAPLEYLSNNVPGVEAFYNWYVKLWE
jgi:hypothetical protein